jgi:hypothetical protein
MLKNNKTKITLLVLSFSEGGYNIFSIPEKYIWDVIKCIVISYNMT